MKKSLFLFFLVVGLTGCAVTPPVKFEGLKPLEKPYVVNKLQEVDYPGYMAGAGYIFSCRYGIFYKRDKEFTPHRIEIFAALLKKNLPSISTSKVVLSQFDVYYNAKLKLLSRAGEGIAATEINPTVLRSLGEAMTDWVDSVSFGFTHEKLLVDVIPDTYPIKTNENAIGCDGKHEGEYYASRVTGGHDVVVTWLKFSVNETEYHFRTIYQFQPSNKQEIQSGISDAIEKTIEAVSTRIKMN